MKKQKVSLKTFKTGKGFSKAQKSEEIYIDVAVGTDPRDYHYQIAVSHGRDRDEALINITFPDGRIWGGTVEELQAELRHPNHIEYKF